ncbi:hypothetical protein ACXZ66_04980 [Corynebacterium sp. S7]
MAKSTKNAPDHETESFIAQLDQAPMPTPATLRRRRSILYQLFRFVVNNLRLARLAFSKH